MKIQYKKLRLVRDKADDGFSFYKNCKNKPVICLRFVEQVLGSIPETISLTVSDKFFSECREVKWRNGYYFDEEWDGWRLVCEELNYKFFLKFTPGTLFFSIKEVKDETKSTTT